jgi:hypothetical protein
MLMATDPAVARDGAIQTQLLLTQGLLLFTTEQVRVRACGDACCYTVANGWRCCWWCQSVRPCAPCVVMCIQHLHCVYTYCR